MSKILSSRDIPNNVARTFTNSTKKKTTEIKKMNTKKSFNLPDVFSLNLKLLLNIRINFSNNAVMILKKISNTPTTRSANIIILVGNLNHSFLKLTAIAKYIIFQIISQLLKNYLFITSHRKHLYLKY